MSTLPCLYTMSPPAAPEVAGILDFGQVISSVRWPDVRGRRCLDVVTRSGMLAFELEARGAAEVVALHVEDVTPWDTPPGGTGAAAAPDADVFETTARGLASRVRHVRLPAADITRERLGSFDLATLAGGRLSLPDRLSLLSRVHGVCERLLSAQPVDLLATAASRRAPAFTLRTDCDADGRGWMLPNSAGHRWMVEHTGFVVEQASKPLVVPFGAGHPRRRPTPRSAADAALQRLVRRPLDRPLSLGLAYSWLTARPAGR